MKFLNWGRDKARKSASFSVSVPIIRSEKHISHSDPGSKRADRNWVSRLFGNLFGGRGEEAPYRVTRSETPDPAPRPRATATVKELATLQRLVRIPGKRGLRVPSGMFGMFTVAYSLRGRYRGLGVGTVINMCGKRATIRVDRPDGHSFIVHHRINN